MRKNIDILNIEAIEELKLNKSEKDELIKDISELCIELRDKYFKKLFGFFPKKGRIEFREVGCRTENRYFILTLYYSFKYPNQIYYKSGKELDANTYADIVIDAYK